MKKIFNKSKKLLLIKKGEALPTNPSYKFETSVKTSEEADRESENIYDKKPQVQAIKIISIPEQKALYTKVFPHGRVVHPLNVHKSVTPKQAKRIQQHFSRKGGGLTRRKIR
jgi:hypothetical protein